MNERDTITELTQEFKEYAYNVSHDLSAPARAMTEFSKLLIKDHANGLNEEGKEFLSLIIENGEKLQKMMDVLLDYSRLNSAAKPQKKIDSHHIAQHCLSVLEAKIEESSAEIMLENLPFIYADANQLTKLLLILLDNALLYQTKGNTPRLHLAAHQAEDVVTFSLSDNGIGIRKEFYSRIYQLFQRLHNDREYPGIGAGLGLARKIVSQHRGKLWCESTPGQGSTFFFTLPNQETTR